MSRHAIWVNLLTVGVNLLLENGVIRLEPTENYKECKILDTMYRGHHVVVHVRGRCHDGDEAPLTVEVNPVTKRCKTTYDAYAEGWLDLKNKCLETTRRNGDKKSLINLYIKKTFKHHMKTFDTEPNGFETNGLFHF